MNQTFNIKRFCRYAWFILSMNRWYYGVLLVLCTVAALFSGFYASDCVGLLYIIPMIASIMPTIDYTMLAAQHGREISIPASWLEKIIIDFATRLWPFFVAFGVHTACVALGANRATGYFADGFQIANIALFLLWVSLWMFFLYCFYAEKNWRGKGQISQSRLAFTWWGAMVFNFAFNFGFNGYNGYNHFAPYSSTTIAIMLVVALVLFVAAAILFRKRNGNLVYESNL